MTKKPNDDELSAEELTVRQFKADLERSALLAKLCLKIEQEDPAEITVPDRLRALDQSKVDKLAESMGTIGLQQAITIWMPSDGELELVAGAHRLAAAIKLRWFEIDVVYVNDLSETDRQIWEVDENLVRAELSPMEHDDHVARRAKLMEARPKLGGKSFPTKPQHKWGSAAYIAELTGLSKRAVNLALSRAKAIPEDVQDQIKGTHLDRGTYLDSLKTLEPEAQRLRVVHDLTEPSAARIAAKGHVALKSARAVLNLDSPLNLYVPLEVIKQAWSRASAEDRLRIKAWVNEQETPVADDEADDA